MSCILGIYPITVKGNFPIFCNTLFNDKVSMDNSALRSKIISELERQNVSVAEIARKAGVPYDAVRDIKRGKVQSTSWERAVKIAQALGIDLEDVSPATSKTKQVIEPASSKLQAMVSVYDVYASAGDGAVVIHEEPIGSLAFPANYLRQLTQANWRDLAIISVKGDSMLPTLADDDVVMLDRSKRDLSYDGLFVIRDNGEALLVKRIQRAPTPGHVMIISDNRALYDPVEKKLSDIEVIGRVIWAGGKV
ncbi:S24 family peptidase [Roseobacter sp. AzwK-3b]|uniref:LexA family transcriptional regulator n=1 Tax=Roseobacter sp. AzwK-3b TaxID=351016 RepID=UPI0006833114|nr:S24 family peptidase [Roseobacter sp. AzwK-3b]